MAETAMVEVWLFSEKPAGTGLARIGADRVVLPIGEVLKMNYRYTLFQAVVFDQITDLTPMVMEVVGNKNSVYFKNDLSYFAPKYQITDKKIERTAFEQHVRAALATEVRGQALAEYLGTSLVSRQCLEAASKVIEVNGATYRYFVCNEFQAAGYSNKAFYDEEYEDDGWGRTIPAEYQFRYSYRVGNGGMQNAYFCAMVQDSVVAVSIPPFFGVFKGEDSFQKAAKAIAEVLEKAEVDMGTSVSEIMLDRGDFHNINRDLYAPATSVVKVITHSGDYTIETLKEFCAELGIKKTGKVKSDIEASIVDKLIASPKSVLDSTHLVVSSQPMWQYDQTDHRKCAIRRGEGVPYTLVETDEDTFALIARTQGGLLYKPDNPPVAFSLEENWKKMILLFDIPDLSSLVPSRA